MWFFAGGELSVLPRFRRDRRRFALVFATVGIAASPRSPCALSLHQRTPGSPTSSSTEARRRRPNRLAPPLQGSAPRSLPRPLSVGTTHTSCRGVERWRARRQLCAIVRPMWLNHVAARSAPPRRRSDVAAYVAPRVPHHPFAPPRMYCSVRWVHRGPLTGRGRGPLTTGPPVSGTPRADALNPDFPLGK